MTRLILAALLSALLGAPATDPRVLGTWQLNVAKSKFSPGAPYRSETRKYETTDRGVKCTITRVFANGRSASIEYVAGYDSMEYPVRGSNDYDTIKLKKVDDVTFEGVLSHADRVVAFTRRLISEDGKTMTITFESPDFQGSPVHNVMVYDRR